ncbi:hypothetical protein DSUL_170032 [Desulfovibrionales bacterium]
MTIGLIFTTRSQLFSIFALLRLASLIPRWLNASQRFFSPTVKNYKSTDRCESERLYNN